MCETLSELLLEKGLKQIDMLDLLSLPEEQDYVVQAYLRWLLEIATDEDAASDQDECYAAEDVYAELERLWDEGVELTVDGDGAGVIDQYGFWRMLVMMPAFFFYEMDEEADDDCDDCDDEAALSGDDLVEVLQLGFDRYRDIPLEHSDFEAVLTAMPDEVCYDFLMDLDDEARLQCLMRLALADDGWLFRMDEEMFRAILLQGGSMVRNSMVQLLDGLGVEFTLVEGAPCDPDWVEACDEPCCCLRDDCAICCCADDGCDYDGCNCG